MNDIIVFRHLTIDDLKEVIDLELSKVRGRLLERGLALELSNDAKDFIIKKGSDTDYGARPLRRALERFIEDPLSEELLRGEFQGKDKIQVEVKEVAGKKQLTFEGLTTEKQEEPVGAVADGGGDGDQENDE